MAQKQASITYRSDQPVRKPECIINEYGPFTRGTCLFRFVRIRRLVHLLEIITDMECAVERAKVSGVCGHIDLIIDG